MAHISKVKYLGYSFYRYKGKCRFKVHPKSVAKVKTKYRMMRALKLEHWKAMELAMTEEVCQALKRVLKNRSNAVPFSVEGYENFLFLKNDGMPKVSANYDSTLKGLVKKYNKQNKEQLPNITPHILRHTFCTRLANAGMNPKALQYIMGHANITMTLNYYAHATYDSAKAEMERLAASPNWCFYYRRTTFGFKIMPRSAKICQVSSDMTNGEKAVKSKTYRHLPRYEKII